MNILYIIFEMLHFLIKAQTQKITDKERSIFPHDYNKYEPPTMKGEPAHVYIDIIVMDIDSINEGKMEYSIQMYMHEYWTDERLNLSVYETNQKEPPVMSLDAVDQMWIPDVVFDNTKDGKLFHLTLPNTVTKVLDGRIVAKTSRYNLIVSCPMNFKLYPMDTQMCNLKLAVLSFTDSKVLLHWSEEHPMIGKMVQSITFQYKINLLKYELTEALPYKECETWTDGNYTYLIANFTFTRRLTSAIFNVYIPSVLVVLLSWISFWVDVEAVPARITLGVTSLLTLTTQVVQVHVGLPPISYMTAMDIWLFGCLVEVFSVLVEYAFAYQFFIWVKQQPVMYDRLQRKEKNSSEPKTQVLQFRKEQKMERTRDYLLEINRRILEKFGGNKYLDKICRTTFPLSFSIFSLAYWIYFLSNK